MENHEPTLDSHFFVLIFSLAYVVRTQPILHTLLKHTTQIVCVQKIF